MLPTLTGMTPFEKKMAIILVGATVIMTMDAIRTKPYTHPQFVADPYIAPQGCAVRSYEGHDDIAESCADRRYLFTGSREYGLQYPGKGGAYYRVGNDLVGINCDYGECHVHGSVEQNVFLVRAGKRRFR